MYAIDTIRCEMKLNELIYQHIGVLNRFVCVVYTIYTCNDFAGRRLLSLCIIIIYVRVTQNYQRQVNVMHV